MSYSTAIIIAAAVIASAIFWTSQPAPHPGRRGAAGLHDCC